MVLAQETYRCASKIGLQQILMMTTQEGGDGTNVSAGDDRNVHLQVLPQVMDKGKVEDWKEEAADCVQEKIFPKQQFLVYDACLDMGGYIQRHVTKFINVSSQSTSRLFWEEHGGREMVRNTCPRKWQAAQNAMKITFKCK
jgi:hypothetical protein